MGFIKLLRHGKEYSLIRECGFMCAAAQLCMDDSVSRLGDAVEGATEAGLIETPYLEKQLAQLKVNWEAMKTAYDRLIAATREAVGAP